MDVIYSDGLGLCYAFERHTVTEGRAALQENRNCVTMLTALMCAMPFFKNNCELLRTMYIDICGEHVCCTQQQTEHGFTVHLSGVRSVKTSLMSCSGFCYWISSLFDAQFHFYSRFILGYCFLV